MDTIDYSSGQRNGRPSNQVDPILQSLEKYWQTLRHAQRLPARNDISPNQIDSVLPFAFILQRVAPGTARFRVAGQKLHEMLKMDARGMPVSTLFMPEARARIQELVEAAFSGPAIVSIPLVSPGTVIRAKVNATMLLLPMRDNTDQPTRVLGALVTDAKAGNRPHRFMIAQNALIRQEPVGVQLAATQLIPRKPVLVEKPDAIRPALRLVVNNA